MYTLEESVTTHINTLIKHGEMFTAYDITKLVRGDKVFTSHNDVRSIVKKYDMPLHYESTIKDGMCIYHRLIDDVDSYDKDKIADVDKTVDTSTLITPVTKSSKPKTKSTGGTRFRFGIKASDIKKITDDASKPLAIYFHNGHLTICKTNIKYVRGYVCSKLPEKCFRFRLSKTMLMKYFDTLDVEYEVNNDHIVVKAS